MAAAAAASSSGIRITDDDSPEGRMSTVPWVSLGVDDDGPAVHHHAAVHAAADEPNDALLARARGCDVYIGHGGGGGGVRRLVSWLLAELELLGVPCFAADTCRDDARSLSAAARAAMDAALASVVVVTPATLANPYAVEEIRAFLDRRVGGGGKILVPVFVGVWRRRRDFAAVEGLAGLVENAVEVRLGDLRGRVLDVPRIVGARLGRPAVAAAVRSWRAAADAESEIPFPWNTAGFVGRERELLAVAAILRGGAATTAAAPPPPARRDDDKAAGKRPMSDQDGSSTSFTGQADDVLEWRGVRLGRVRRREDGAGGKKD